MNRANYIVYDFETGSKYPDSCEVLQVAAVAVDARSLKIMERYSSYIKPNCKFSELDPGAIAKNKIQEQDLDKAPNLATVWKQFVAFTHKFTKRPGNVWDAPIAVGHNIKNFDNVITNRLCRAFGQIDKDMNVQNIFNYRHQIDFLDFLFPWFENQTEPATYSLDVLRKFFGLPLDGAHNAIVDVEQCAQILIRFQKFSRNVVASLKPKFQGCFNEAVQV